MKKGAVQGGLSSHLFLSSKVITNVAQKDSLQSDRTRLTDLYTRFCIVLVMVVGKKISNHSIRIDCASLICNSTLRRYMVAALQSYAFKMAFQRVRKNRFFRLVFRSSPTAQLFPSQDNRILQKFANQS